MTTKFTHHPNGFLEITGCPNCDEAWYLWFYEGVWRLDDSDGMTGTEVNYCPWCGVRLEPPVVEAYPLPRVPVECYRLIASPEGEYFRYTLEDTLPTGFREVPSATVEGRLLSRFWTVGRYGREQHGWKPKSWEIRSLRLEES